MEHPFDQLSRELTIMNHGRVFADHVAHVIKNNLEADWDVCDYCGNPYPKGKGAYLNDLKLCSEDCKITCEVHRLNEKRESL